MKVLLMIVVALVMLGYAIHEKEEYMRLAFYSLAATAIAYIFI